LDCAATNNQFVCNDAKDCSLLNKHCNVWGDPHIETFDGILYHPQTEGYFKYITDCQDSELPFEIAAYHKNCNLGTPYTCVREVIVIIRDILVGEKTISFPSNGLPRNKRDNSIVQGPFRFDDGNGNSGVYQVSKSNFKIEYQDVNGKTIKLELTYSGWTLLISTSDCLKQKLCGLCGYFDGDNGANDFRKCSDGNTISSANTANMRTMTNAAWANQHTFADSCCHFELDRDFLGITTQCPDTTPPDPINAQCLNAANAICQTAWNNHCQACAANQNLDYNTFIGNCEIDLCVAVNGNLNGVTYNSALQAGHLDTSIDGCNVVCSECGGCSSGGLANGNNCYKLTDDDNVFACRGTFTNGMNDQSAIDICNAADGYHICESASEAQQLGLTAAQCSSVGNNEMYFSKESSNGGWNCNSDSNTNGVNDIWGCGGADGSGTGKTLFNRMCRQANKQLCHNTFTTGCSDGNGMTYSDANGVVINLGNAVAEVNAVSLNDEQYGGVLCCKQ